MDDSQYVSETRWGVMVGVEQPRQMSLGAIVQRISEVSTLPALALRMIAMCQDEQTGIADLESMLEADPPLAARVIRCANCASFGIRYQVTSLQRAISLLGFKIVRNLAVTASVSPMFRRDNRFGAYDRRGLWQHLVASALVARMLAGRYPGEDPEEAFLAGLLHDIGIILEDQYAHLPFQRMMQRLRPDDSLVAAEVKSLGFDHTALGSRFVERWGLPDSLRAVIRYHHAPGDCGEDFAGRVAIVHAAGIIAARAGHPSARARIDPIAPQVRSLLDLDDAYLQSVTVRLMTEMEAHRGLWQL